LEQALFLSFLLLFMKLKIHRLKDMNLFTA
jgi:hypothetical protein